MKRSGYQRLDGEEDNVWLGRAIKSIAAIVMLSVTTWAFLRANRNGAFTEMDTKFGSIFSRSSGATPESTGLVFDNELEHEWNHQEDGEWSTAESITSSTPARDGGLFAMATNEYSTLNHKMFPYPFLENAMLAEPYKSTKITISGMSGDTFYWSIVNVKDPSISFHGEAEDCLDFSITLTVVGEYKLTVEEQYDGLRDQTSMRTLKQSIWVKYVRREISTLTTTDREDFLDAFKQLWDIQTKKGKEKYGDLYKSLNYFALIHNDGGGNYLCDEFHDGTGFFNNHVYLRLYLEQSLRLIDPKVSLHYMDYSKYFESDAFTSGHMKNSLDGGSWTEILSDTWFGSNDPTSGRLLDSRWKDTIVPAVTSKLQSEEGIPLMAYLFVYDDFKKSDAHMSNPYGLLRAPWNYNPSEYLTRYNNLNRLSTANLPMSTKFSSFYGTNCAGLKSFFGLYAAGKTLTNFLEAVEESVHAATRYTFGGAGGDHAAAVDAKLKAEYGFTDEQLFYIAEASHPFAETYLSGRFLAFSQNPMNCSATPTDLRETGILTTTAAPGEEGGPSCGCNSYYFTDEAKTDELMNLYFVHLVDGDSSILDTDFESKKAIMQLICSRMSMDGDIVGSGAAMDPLFWVTHGAVERLYQRVMFEDVLTADTFVNSKRGAPCPGHESATFKTWLSGYYLLDTSIDTSTLSNVELAEILDPRGDKYRDLLDSVFDSESYDWCGEEFDSWLQPSEVNSATSS